ncbi:CvpA family protein, partial [Actinotignum timonense]|nr:CvpA family protein [Actinotignum timonense]
MISLVILLILAWSFYIGYSRGIVLQAYYTASAVISAIIAGQLYQSLGEQINLLVPYASAQEG